MESIIKISKLDIAKKELDEAIRMFMLSSDMLIIHLVASSSHTILRDLCRLKKLPIMQDELAETVKKVLPHKHKYFINKLHEAHNFLKHADKDPDAILEFNPEATLFIIIEAIDLYEKLVGEITGIMYAYKVWFSSEYSDLLMNPIDKEAFFKTIEGIDLKDKRRLLELGELLDKQKRTE